MSPEREEVADLLDDLLQVIAEGTRGGIRRVPTRDRLPGSAWVARFEELSNETQASIRALKRRTSERLPPRSKSKASAEKLW